MTSIQERSVLIVYESAVILYVERTQRDTDLYYIYIYAEIFYIDIRNVEEIV